MAKIEEAINATPSPALGPDEVLSALEQARAHHVIFDATRDWEKRDGLPISELMIERGAGHRGRRHPGRGPGGSGARISAAAPRRCCATSPRRFATRRNEMALTVESDSISHGERVPDRHAFGVPDGSRQGGAGRAATAALTCAGRAIRRARSRSR